MEYMNNIFTQNTIFEVKFMTEELDPKSRQRLLNVGCGSANSPYSVLMLSAGLAVAAR